MEDEVGDYDAYEVKCIQVEGAKRVQYLTKFWADEVNETFTSTTTCEAIESGCRTRHSTRMLCSGSAILV